MTHATDKHARSTMSVDLDDATCADAELPRRTQAEVATTPSGAHRLPEQRPRAPRPSGPLSGKRTPLRRFLARSTAAVNRALDALPPGRWLHRAFCPRVHIHHVDVHLSRGHPKLDGLEIAFLSDLHAGSFLDADELVDLFRRVQAEQPDVVCFGGDLINTREREILLYKDALAELSPPFGIFAVPGNHDHFFGTDIGLWESWLTEHGVNVLNNRGQRIERDGAGLWIAGVDDLTEGTPDLESALAGVQDEPVVLLAHHPDFFFEAAAVDVDLTLSGHTHGGQVRFGNIVPLHHSRFDWIEGRHEVAGSQLYVGRGIGVTFLPLRIGAPPEVPILRLRVGSV
ncbi:MAG: metallophosphoesterase [Planctomycetes bacterium]|nr:metallophosphoesterase [Planctomycetota bacterium]